MTRTLSCICTLMIMISGMLVISLSATVVAADRPNLIWIMADDLGYGELGCYGQQVIRTPQLDRMAAEGLRFTQFYAGATVCAPSRSVLMTGQHHGHTRVRGNAGRENPVAQALRPDDRDRGQGAPRRRLRDRADRQVGTGRCRAGRDRFAPQAWL